MNLTAFIDLLNSSICFALGVYVLTKVLHIFKSKHTDFTSLFVVASGTFAWMLKLTLSAAPVIPHQIIPNVTWSPNDGYTLGRVMLMPVWVYLLYLIKK